MKPSKCCRNSRHTKASRNMRPGRSGDIKHSLADISKAAAGFGYKPSVNFDEGLRRTVDWYRAAGVRR